MPDFITRLLRLAYAVVLTLFRWLPAPLRRALVRAGTPSFTVGAVCVIEHDGALLMLRQPHRQGWSLPGGLLERGERTGEAVVREAFEETGLTIEVGVPLTVQVNPYVRRVDVIYRITVDSRPPVRAGGEARQVRWLRPDEILPTADGPTREILELLDRATVPGAAEGRVVGP
jgi:ADP-ribose pyrophosphatase YjhB (NUDIX family)